MTHICRRSPLYFSLLLIVAATLSCEIVSGQTEQDYLEQESSIQNIELPFVESSLAPLKTASDEESFDYHASTLDPFPTLPPSTDLLPGPPLPQTDWQLPCDCGVCSECCAVPCCEPVCNRFAYQIFADYLHLHVRDADIPFALPQDGFGVGAVPVGAVGVADPDFDMGFRVGVSMDIDCDSRITSTLTWFDTSTTEEITTAAPYVINPLLLFPGSFNAGFLQQDADASYKLDFQLVDVDYHAVKTCCDKYWIGYLVGARYGRLEQELTVNYDFAPADGSRTLDAAVNFDGAGLRLGLEGERTLHPCGCLTVFGRGVANFLAGEFRARYFQNNQFAGVEAVTTFSDDKIVPVLELELGIAYVSKSGRFRLSAGYMMNAWMNAITIPEWIDGVQQTDFNFNSLDDMLTIDGLFAGIDFRF